MRMNDEMKMWKAYDHNDNNKDANRQQTNYDLKADDPLAQMS